MVFEVYSFMKCIEICFSKQNHASMDDSYWKNKSEFRIYFVCFTFYLKIGTEKICINLKNRNERSFVMAMSHNFY